MILDCELAYELVDVIESTVWNVKSLRVHDDTFVLRYFNDITPVRYLI